MSRSIWFVAGAGAGIYAMTRARRIAETFTSDGLRDRLGALAVGARMFRDEVRAGQHESETDLRERMGLVPHGVPELTAGGFEAQAPGRLHTSTSESTQEQSPREIPDEHR